jgi:Ca2+-binding EF-hand superfamily protein
MDDNGSQTLDSDEFSKAMRDYRVNLETIDLIRVFRLFDRDGNGEINYDEFLRAIVGPMNDRRRTIVTLAYKKLDKDGSGLIDIQDLKGVYNASAHPDVRSNKKTEEDVLYEFLDTFEQHYALSNPDARDRSVNM